MLEIYNAINKNTVVVFFSLLNNFNQFFMFMIKLSIEIIKARSIKPPGYMNKEQTSYVFLFLCFPFFLVSCFLSL